MSPSVGNFVHDLVEMAKAMEELPLVQQELSRVRAESESQSAAIAAREESILRLKSEIEALQGRVRDAEVSRDDAELRFLELDEKAGKVLRLVASITDSTTAAREMLSPPKPMPETEQPKVEAVQTQAEPIAPQTAPEQHVNPYANEPMPKPASESPQGQSEPHPTTATDTPVSSESAPTQNVESWVRADTTSGEAKFYDDPGYHNEPTKWTPEWSTWASRMDSRYGPHFWPERPSEAAAS